MILDPLDRTLSDGLDLRLVDTDGRGEGFVGDFREFCEARTGGLEWHPHTECLADEIQLLGEDRYPAEMTVVNAPPAYGKTHLLIELAAAWYLARHPSRRVCIGGYDMTQAGVLSRRARDFYIAAGGKVKRGAGSQDWWETEDGGACWTTAPRAAYLGRHYDLLLVDDPFSRERGAQTMVEQELVLQWWDALKRRRMKISKAPSRRWLVHQRLAPEDLAGILYERGEADRCIFLPAIMPSTLPHFLPEDTVLPAVDAGESLAPRINTLEDLAAIEAEDPAWFHAIYLQNPILGAGGHIFQEANLLLCERHEIPQCNWVRAWDLGYTPGAGDWTVGALFGAPLDSSDPRRYVADIARNRISWSELSRRVYDISRQDEPGTMILIPEDHKSVGEELPAQIRLHDRRRLFREKLAQEEPDLSAEALAERVKHCPVDLLPPSSLDIEVAPRPSKSKMDRAIPLAACTERQEFYILSGQPWTRGLIAELTSFAGIDSAVLQGGSRMHDDQVDACSDGYAWFYSAPY